VVEEKIKQLLEKKFEEKEYSDCFLIEITKNNSKVQVFIDCDSELTLKKCTRISRYLEHVIDEEGWLGEKYTLEVSSPGATKPLVTRQFPKHIGRKVKVKLDHGKVEGILKAVNENSVIVSYIEIERIKKKKIKTEIDKEIDFKDIKELKVIISF